MPNVEEIRAPGIAGTYSNTTAHATKANTTHRERAGIAFHFLHTDCVERANLIDKNRGQPLLVGPEASGGRAEYGVQVAGTWEQEIERVLQEVTN